MYALGLYPVPSPLGVRRSQRPLNDRDGGATAARAAPAARAAARASTRRCRRRQGNTPGGAGSSGHRTPRTRRAHTGAAPRRRSAPSAPPPLLGTACAAAAAPAVEQHAAGAVTCAVKGMESLPKRVHMRLPHGVGHSGCAGGTGHLNSRQGALPRSIPSAVVTKVPVQRSASTRRSIGSVSGTGRQQELGSGSRGWAGSSPAAQPCRSSRLPSRCWPGPAASCALSSATAGAAAPQPPSAARQQSAYSGLPAAGPRRCRTHAAL